jgi:hypothetical protein
VFPGNRLPQCGGLFTSNLSDCSVRPNDQALERTAAPRLDSHHSTLRSLSSYRFALRFSYSLPAPHSALRRDATPLLFPMSRSEPVSLSRSVFTTETCPHKFYVVPRKKAQARKRRRQKKAKTKVKKRIGKWVRKSARKLGIPFGPGPGR